MIPVLWNIDPLDWCSSDAVCVAGRVIAKAEENDIILMHDYYESSVTAALKIVDRLLKEGYVFVTVEEILFE
jgi:peptidoglycan/xylan/chitin deacetylase (PgdA/CDA1 family)